MTAILALPLRNARLGIRDDDDPLHDKCDIFVPEFFLIVFYAMFKVAPRLIARPTAFRAIPRTFAIPQRRLLSTAPPSQKSRSWKSLGARLGAAGGLIYFYNTTDVFAEEPQRRSKVPT